MTSIIKSIKSYLQNLPPSRKHQGIGFLIGIITPIALTLLRQSILKLQKVRKETANTYVGIEIGGTNFKVAIGSPQFDRKGNLIGFLLKKQMDGRTSQVPQETIKQITTFLTKNEPQNVLGFDFVGIASFGPLCLDSSSNIYGSITSTPKVEWRNMQLLKTLKSCIRARQFCIQTDVNASAFAEYKLGQHQCKQSLVYITVGTGVGVGVVTQKKTLHGLTHPEGGHIIIKISQQQYENFQGVCPYHKNCLQGMVCNKAIAKRVNKPATDLHEIDDQDKVWRLIGFYLAQLALNLTLILSPQVIVIGGGVMNRKIIYKYMRESFLTLLSSYVHHPLFTLQNVGKYIKEPKLGATVGIKGGMILNYMKD